MTPVRGTESHFDGIAEIYDETLPAHVMDHYRARRKAFLLPLVGTGPVLDIGAGTGKLAIELAGAARVVGIDFSHEMIRRAPNPILRVHASAGRIPARSNAFSLVYTVATLHHFFDRALCASALAEMWRVVAPGGTLVIWDHNPLNPYWPFLMARVPQDDEPTRLVPLGEIEEILRRAGAADLAHHRWGWIPEFCPKAFLGAAGLVEHFLEHVPGIKEISAHNIVVARKPA